jgi:putative membrane protein
MISSTRTSFARRGVALAFGIYLFIYIWSVPMLMFDLVPTWGTWMGGALLILQGSLLTGWLWMYAGLRGVLAAAIIALLSFAVEHIGVTTGFPFGHYTYTDTLGTKLGGAVPIPIPFAWLMVIPGTIGMARVLNIRGTWVGIVAPLLALVLDLTLEPVIAYVTGYWQWIADGPYYGVPTANFFAWGATAWLLTIITLVLTRLHTKPMAWFILPAIIYLLNLLQFTLVNLAYGYFLAAAIGAVAFTVCVKPTYIAIVNWWHTSAARTSRLERA